MNAENTSGSLAARQRICKCGCRREARTPLRWQACETCGGGEGPQLEHYLSSFAEYRVHSLALVWLSTAFALKTPLLWDWLHVHLHLYRARPAAATLFLAAAIANACFVFLWMFLWLLFTLRWGPRQQLRTRRLLPPPPLSRARATLVENRHAESAVADAAAVEMRELPREAAAVAAVRVLSIRSPGLGATSAEAAAGVAAARAPHQHLQQFALENPAYEPTPVAEPQRSRHTRRSTRTWRRSFAPRAPAA